MTTIEESGVGTYCVPIPHHGITMIENITNYVHHKVPLHLLRELERIEIFITPFFVSREVLPYRKPGGLGIYKELNSLRRKALAGKPCYIPVMSA